MRKACFIMVCLIAGVFSLASFASPVQDNKDKKGCKDHPLFTRMQNFYIGNCKDSTFDSFNFEELKDGKWSKTLVEGRKYEFFYYLRPGAAKPGVLEIVQNHISAIKAAGGTILGEKKGVAVMKLIKDGNETWARVFAYAEGGTYQLIIVEKKAMVQQVLTDAKTMASDIDRTGKVSLYGIYFDFNKADVKPESEPELKEIARLLSENPGLKLYLVGHTDNVGGFEYNMKLSQARAEAVVKILASKYKVDANRLKHHGVGSLAPIASNRTEDGRAKNRRVELVEQ